MGKAIKVYIGETIGECNAATTTRGILRTDQVHRTGTRGPRIHGIHSRIRGSIWRSMYVRYGGPGTHYTETRMEPRSKIVTDNKVKTKRRTINFRLRDGSLIDGVGFTGRSVGTSQTQICGHVIR